MFHFNRTARTFPAKAAMLLCTALVTEVASAAPPTLQSVAVTPAASSISVGQTQLFKAAGTFSDGSTHVLGRAVSHMSLGTDHTCVLLTAGGVDCWGNNDYGQLGNGSTVDSLVARPVKGITTATAVSLRSGPYGQAGGCALLGGGAVQCWGRGDHGQLGNGTTANSPWAVRVIGIGSATAVDAGGSHSCAVLESGAVQCWGYNAFGQLGDGTTTDSASHVPVTGIASATAVAAGGEHSCALLASGAVQCWGRNYDGQLGNGTATDSNTPVTVSGINNAVAVAAGTTFSCALLASGSVQCWGDNYSGELGGGTIGDSNVPVPVAGIGTAVAITAGGFHACVLLSSGSAQCWGLNRWGQLCNGSIKAYASNTPIPVSGTGALVRLEAGYAHTCALLSDGAMRCWGLDNEGQLGNRRRTGDTPHRWPVSVIGTPGVEWQSSDPSKARITMRGMATAIATGNTTITATTPGFINDNAVLTVK